MRYGELHRLIVEHGRHQVWALRQQKVSWDEVAGRLGISGDRARSWYLKWGPKLEGEYLERWGTGSVRIVIGSDELRILASTTDPTSTDSAGASPIPEVAVLDVSGATGAQAELA